MEIVKYFKDVTAGSFGGMASVIASHPIDTVKSRMQTQGSLGVPVRYRSGVHCFFEIIKTEGPRGLYKGFWPPFSMQAVINAIVFGVEGPTQRYLTGKFTDGPWKEFNCGLFAGMTAGFAQTVVCAPMELVKLRTQHLAIGEVTSYEGNLATLVKIHRLDGLRGCYKGFWITALRDTPAFGVYFATYEGLMHFAAKRREANRDNMGNIAAFFFGGFAGMASWIVNYPVELIKTRVQMDGVDGAKRQYKGSWDCFKKLYQEGGVRFGLYRGFLPCLLRGFLNSSVLFVAFENTKKYLF